MATTACERHADHGAVVVSTVQSTTPSVRSGGLPLTDDDTSRRVLRDALAQGLVRFDANGQIEPGLAERWIGIVDG